MRTQNKVTWVVFAFLAIGVGLYPLLYFVMDTEVGLLSSKSQELLQNTFWKLGFYGHISFGGLALLVGWSQFSKKLRTKYLWLHRNLGMVYVLSAWVSGACGVGIGFYATGGWVSALGFILLGLIWLYTTFSAYTAIKNKDLGKHQAMMIYSYAACFAAVTLRLWLPILTFAFGEFIVAYRIVAWLCWVPNMMFAHYWVRKKGMVLG